MQYNKPFQSIDQQLTLLSQRGLVVDVDAADYLKHLNYYRLSGYWLPFYEDGCTHQFKTNTRFTDVLNLYIFDRELRLLLLDAIERIEVSVKTQWAYYFSESHGSYAYMECKLSNNIQWHAQNIILLEKELKRSDELFISHYQKTYNSPSMPPIWVMQMPRTKPKHLINSFNFDELSNRKIYNSLVMMLYLLNIIGPKNHFKDRLMTLINVHAIQPIKMGSPVDWKQRSIWL